MKEKLFWPLVIVAVAAILVVVFVLVDGEDDDEIAGQFIEGYRPGGTPGEVAQPGNRTGSMPPNLGRQGQTPPVAETGRGSLWGYFAGNMVKFGYGGGTSSNNPRVELVIHYCASGTYYSSGQSCRPNIIAKGYQCTPVQDAGRWQVSGAQGQGRLEWMSNGGGPGSIALQVRNDGVVVDPRGNPFSRIGRAQCQ